MGNVFVKITHKMIAEATGFTQSTVSKALSSTGHISEETIAIIRKAANEMGYYSQLRRDLRNKETRLFPQIAVLVPEITSWYYSNIVEKIQQQIEWLGGALWMYITGFNHAKVNLYIDHINRLNLFDGIVVLGGAQGSVLSDIPVIFLQQLHMIEPSDNLYQFKQEYGHDLALRHLTELGHREIGFIGEKHTISKLEDFCTQMMLQNIPIHESYLYTSSFRFERIGHDGIQAFHIRGSMPSGILCAYDEVAFGAIEELEKLGYRVPEDVSVIGNNNVEYSAYFKPPLTTWQSNLSVLIEKIMEIIQKAVLEEKECEHNFTVPADLIVRKSTAPCRKR